MALAICSCGLTGPLAGVVFRHDVDAAAYRELAAREPFSAVVAIEVDTGFGLRRGSGVVVADGWVLSAAHVTWGGGDVRLATSGSAANGLHYADGWSASPQPGLAQGNDLVLIRIATPGGIVAPTIATSLETGAIGILGGFGRTGTGVLGASGPAGLAFGMNVVDRRIATVGGGGLLVTDFDDGTSNRNALDAATARRTYYDLGFDDPLLTTTVLDAAPGTSLAGFATLPTAADYFPGLADVFLEGSSAPGDSGGPLYVLDNDARWELAGLVSWGINPLLPEGFARTDSRYGDLAFHTDLTAHREWILSTIPEPRMAVLVLLAAGSGFSRRRARARSERTHL